MNGSTATATVTSIIPTETVPVTQSTVDWLSQLYQAGAVIFEADMTVTLDPQVRQIIRSLHAILSGGTVKVDIVDEGGTGFENLEKIFTKAWDDANLSNRFVSDNGVIVMMP